MKKLMSILTLAFAGTAFAIAGDYDYKNPKALSEAGVETVKYSEMEHSADHLLYDGSDIITNAAYFKFRASAAGVLELDTSGSIRVNDHVLNRPAPITPKLVVFMSASGSGGYKYVHTNDVLGNGELSDRVN